jgi:hypothetical protein
LCLPAWYRAADSNGWQTGLSRSVSATGALIRADGPELPSGELIVAIELPWAAGCLVGSGRVVRLINAQDRTAPLTFAVQVSRYRLERCDSVVPRMSIHRRIAAG